DRPEPDRHALQVGVNLLLSRIAEPARPSRRRQDHRETSHSLIPFLLLEFDAPPGVDCAEPRAGSQRRRSPWRSGPLRGEWFFGSRERLAPRSPTTRWNVWDRNARRCCWSG